MIKTPKYEELEAAIKAVGLERRRWVDQRHSKSAVCERLANLRILRRPLFLHAVQRKLPIMALLLDEQYLWPPQLIDRFDTTHAQAPANATPIRALRHLLQQEQVVSWFTTSTDLEARVGAAVTVAGLTRQLDLQPKTWVHMTEGVLAMR